MILSNFLIDILAVIVCLYTIYISVNISELTITKFAAITLTWTFIVYNAIYLIHQSNVVIHYTDSIYKFLSIILALAVIKDIK